MAGRSRQARNGMYTRYYKAVAGRMMPFLEERPVAVSWQAGAVFSRRDMKGPIRVDCESMLMEWVERGAKAFHVSPIAETGEVWFALALDSGNLPFEAVRLTALKLLLVLEDVQLDGMLTFDGRKGIGLLWSYGVFNSDEINEDLWKFQHRVAAAIQERLEQRLASTPERDRIGRWIGYEGPVTRLEGIRIDYRTGGAIPSSPGEGHDLVVISTSAMTPNGLVRAPLSLHEETGLSVMPVSRSDLYSFDMERGGAPERARRLRRLFEVPLNLPKAVITAFEL